MGKADLHIHTTASDGSCEPAELPALAESKLLSTISITDHDTIDGYLKAREATSLHPVRIIPGVEVTAVCNHREIHILAYNFNPLDEELNLFLKRQRRARVVRMDRILETLRKKEGIDVTLDEVQAQARSNNVGRPHVAQILVKKKIVASVAEAFIRYLGASLIKDITTDYTSIEDLVQVIRKAGGVTILAHPGPLYDVDEVAGYLEMGLDGVECIHPSHNFEKQKLFTGLAENRHALVTGGSDFHGTGKKYDPYFGIVTVSEKRVLDLERITRNRKNLKMNIES